MITLCSAMHPIKFKAKELRHALKAKPLGVFFFAPCSPDAKCGRVSAAGQNQNKTSAVTSLLNKKSLFAQLCVKCFILSAAACRLPPRFRTSCVPVINAGVPFTGVSSGSDLLRSLPAYCPTINLCLSTRLLTKCSPNLIRRSNHLAFDS